MVHELDFLTSDTRSIVKWMEERMGDRFDVNAMVVDMVIGEVQDVRILNIRVRVTTWR